MRNKEVLKRANELNRARYSMTATEQDVIYMAMVQFKDDDPIDQKYSIYIPELEKLTGSRPGYSYLKEVTKKLISRVYKIPKEKGFFELNILSIAKYKKRTGCIELQFSPEVRDFFFALKENYTGFQFQAALKLTSKYAKRMYEMLCQFKKTGVFNISVQELKERLGLIDLETGKEEYEKFGLFAAYVLKPSNEEINANTDITFKYSTKKTGRKITDLRFKVYPKEIQKDLSAHILEDSKVSALEERLVNESKISKVLARDVVKTFSAEKILGVIKAILKENQAGKINKLGAYSKTIFEEWLNGAEPTFEKSKSPKKYISTKSVNQTNQIAVLENEIQEKLTNEFEIKYHQVYGLIVSYGGDLEKLKELQDAISIVESAIERKEIDRNPETIFEALISQLNIEVEHSDQPMVAQADERSNAVNNIGILVHAAIPNHKMQIESAEEEKIRKEKTGIWQELIVRFEMDDEKAHDFVEEYCVEALNYAISIVVETLKNHIISRDPAIIDEELRKHASLWMP